MRRKEVLMKNKKTFIGLIKECNRICIPEIQRDYAQGRDNEKVNEIRKRFVHILMRVVKGQEPEQELDFVYGSNHVIASDNDDPILQFEPLDGQQRLTTLFLLHWMMGCGDLISSDSFHSVFTYCTRPSSEEFCNELVQHSAWKYIEEARSKKPIQGQQIKPSAIIKSLDWFKWGWKFDPTVKSMLVMIDSIFDEMEGINDTSSCVDRLNNITFKLLDLQKFNASDELFVKMNARGKHLTGFDILKSTLEEELQIQQQERKPNTEAYYATKEDEKRWRSKMDGAWIDMFWNKYARPIVESTEDKFQKKKAAEEAEVRFRRLLIRLIALQFLEDKNSPDKLKEVCYHVNEKDLDNIMFRYDDYMIEVRQKSKQQITNDGSVRINFTKLIEDIDHLIINKNTDESGEITELLGSILEPDGCTLLDEFLKEDRLGNDIELIVYSLLQYLNIVPNYNEKKTEAWRRNYKEWAYFMRNIFLNENRNSRIDKMWLMENAMSGIRQFANEFRSFVSISDNDVVYDGNVVRRFVASQDKQNKSEKGMFSGFENQTLSEEIDKALLKLSNPQWEIEIEKAECHQYLWGQINCLINWSNNDLGLFKEYTQRLHDLLDTILDNMSKDWARSYYQGVLSVIPNYWKDHNNRLYEFNKHRDNSIKRCLRDKDKEEVFLGFPQKVLIDEWRKEEYKQLSANDFLFRLRQDSMESVPGWVKCIFLTPQTIDYSWRKKVFEDRGHVILAQLQTIDSHCFDPILKSIHIMTGGTKGKFGDSKSSDGHFVKFELDNNTYLIKWSEEPGMYEMSIGNNSIAVKTSENTIIDIALKIKENNDKH